MDKRYLSRISGAADLSPGDVVVEVGPGLGVLTRHLAERARRVVAIELDDALANRLKSELADHENVEVLHDDARSVDLDAVPRRRQPATRSSRTSRTTPPCRFSGGFSRPSAAPA